MSGANYNLNSQEETLFDPDADPGFGISTDRLVEVVPQTKDPTDTTAQAAQPVAPASDPYGEGGDPGLAVVLESLAPGNPEYHRPPRIERAVSIDPDGDTAMPDQIEGGRVTETSGIHGQTEPQQPSEEATFEAKLKSAATQNVPEQFDPLELQEKATAGLRAQEATAQGHDDGGAAVPEKRHDSHQEQEAPLSPDRDQNRQHGSLPSLQPDTRRESAPDESITSSPNLSKHVMRVDTDRPETLAAFQHHHSPTGDGSAGSPRGAILPPIHQIVPTPSFRPLNELAELATQHDARAPHHHSPSFGSAASQSPGLPYHPCPGLPQMSPSSQHAYSARSPTSGFSDPYGSPTQYAAPVAYYTSRRSSAPTDRPPGPPPSIPSVSSSGDSHGHASSVDGYSTAQTTPIDPAEATPRPMLPPPLGMVIAPGYKCDVPDCPAPPFQTQYLLRYVIL